MKCPFCGTDNPPGEEFCVNCGGQLNATPPPAGTTGSTSPSITPFTGITTGDTTTGGTHGNSRTLVPNMRLQNGRYVVEKMLGQGGMGAAVLARDSRVSNKPVVIKELVSDNTDPVKRQEDVENFKREVDTLAQIDHPLVPTVTDSFQEGSRYFMVQEYAAGETLEHKIENEQKPLSEREVLTYASQILDILDYLSHLSPPIVHRDIKPANIIIGAKDKRARLVDFGIARADVAKNAKRKQTSALGTPGYAPPEQYQGNADARSDLYALAATMHHLLTNRDPRDYPPFNYPPARSLNPQLSNDVEKLLERALTLDIHKRYQNAAAMKHDVDEILAQRFHTSGAEDTIIGVSGKQAVPNVAASAATQGQSAPQRVYRPQQVSQVPPPPPPPNTPPRFTQRPPAGPAPFAQQQRQQQAGMYGAPPAQRGSGLIRNLVLLILVLLLIAAAALFVLPKLTVPGVLGSNNSGSSQAGSSNPGSSGLNISLQKGIGTVTTSTGEVIGISDGSYAFDTNRTDGQAKQQGADALKNGDAANAKSNWRSATQQETNDAEPLIYLENQNALNAKSYITVVVPTMLTGSNDVVSVGRQNLQGAYIAQKEFNQNAQQHGGVMMRLLVANSGSSKDWAKPLADAIARAQQQDKTIVGVMGWPYSSRALNAYKILDTAHLPVVSPTASSDDLTGASPYFFRVAPADDAQGKVAANYAFNTLKARKIAVFTDPTDPYSRSLGGDFQQAFAGLGGTVISENYTEGKADSIANTIQTTLQQNPDMIYFAGYAKDLSPVLNAIPDSSKIKVMGGDALYSLGGYDPNTKGWTRLLFTTFAYPDEWEVLGHGDKKPVFFKQYASTYDPLNQHVKENTYDFSRPQYNAILAYDALLAINTASQNLIAQGKSSFTGQDLQQALTQLTGAKAIQGVSGQISFNAQNDPQDKAVLIVYVDASRFTKMQGLGAGKFLVGE